jgi:hypothetical protein
VREKAVSAAGAAFVSAVIVNPLDVAKVKPAGEFFWRGCLCPILSNFFPAQRC